VTCFDDLGQRNFLLLGVLPPTHGRSPESNLRLVDGITVFKKSMRTDYTGIIKRARKIYTFPIDKVGIILKAIEQELFALLRLK
jgi:hypothetical protein